MLWQHYLNHFPPNPVCSLPHFLLHEYFHAPPQHSPEPLSLVVKGAWVSAIGGLVQLWQKGLAGLLAGVVGELDRDGLCGTWWLLSIQALDGLLSLYPLIKADEAHTSGATCGASRSQTNTGPFYFTGFRQSSCNPYICTTCLCFPTPTMSNNTFDHGRKPDTVLVCKGTQT